MLKVNQKKLKAYGDRLDDGAMQISFTFPVAASAEAKEAAKRYVESMGLEKVAISSMEPMGGSFTFFVAYGCAKHSIDLTKIKVPKVEGLQMKYEDLKNYMATNLDRPLVVVGAAIGSDAHTVGIDAIMNMKGYDHDYGLERYPHFRAHNLRSQITAEDLIAKAAELKADAILISQVVTQRDSHIKNLKEFRAMAKDKGLSKDIILIVGGPRLDHAMALKLGFDAGFGVGTKPSQVASFIVTEFMKRNGIKEKPPAEGPKKEEFRSPHREGHHHVHQKEVHSPRPREQRQAPLKEVHGAHVEDLEKDVSAETAKHEVVKPAQEAAGVKKFHGKRPRRRGRRGGRNKRKNPKPETTGA